MSTSRRFRALAGSALAIALIASSLVANPASARPPGDSPAKPSAAAPVKTKAAPTGSATAAEAGRQVVKAAKKPAAPARPIAGKRGGTAVVSWKKPAENGSRITGYVVQPYRNGKKVAKPANFDASTTTQTIKISPASGAWTFTVAATNGVGTGPASRPSSAARLLALPSAPEIIALATDITAARLSWRPPADTGGFPVINYLITPYIGGIAEPPQSLPAVTSGQITGLTPATTYTFTVRARTAAGTGPESVPSFAVTTGLSPSVTFVGNPGNEGAAYLANVVGENGAPPFTWSIDPGSPGGLPPGITLDPVTGAVSGIPAVGSAGDYPVIFRATDSFGRIGTLLATIVINKRPDIVIPVLALGEVDAAYSQPLTVLGGTAPFTWSLVGGTLPPGVSLAPTTGIISGIPTAGAVGVWGADIQVTDANGQTDVQGIQIRIQAASVVTLIAATPTNVFAGEESFTVLIGPGIAEGSVNLFGTGPFGVTRLLGNFPVERNRASFAVRMPNFGLNTFQVQYIATNTNAVTFSGPVTVDVRALPGQLLIGQFRQSGIDGPLDQYVGIYNNTAIEMPLNGVQIEAPGGVVRTIGATTVPLAPRRVFLVAAPNFSLAGEAEPDVEVPSLGTGGGLRIRTPDTAGTIVDAAGSVPGYYTGTPLPAFTSPPFVQFVWGRQWELGLPQDTRNNAVDFRLAATTYGPINGVPSALGAPSPRWQEAPVITNDLVQSTRLDPNVPINVAPNREVIPAGGGQPQRLVIRRLLTNRSTLPATFVQLRIQALSQVNGAPPPLEPLPPTQGNLRLINPVTPVQTITISDGRTFTVHNLVMQPPATYPPGGGLFTRLELPLPIGGLRPGASIAVALTFAIDTPGRFWIYWDTETLGLVNDPGPTIAKAGAPAKVGTPGRSGKATSLNGDSGTLR
ncbi:fibronectin type III domain-containing protein [Plantactinospora sp. GCM10030261]|uniref:fibronectin type III domain-containing protein n=1 Tax=Plantactinospora sp. GCM10030261 TaxID=3273420 RepID=UPI00360A6667